jgi:hypothetical protein
MYIKFRIVSRYRYSVCEVLCSWLRENNVHWNSELSMNNPLLTLLLYLGEWTGAPPILPNKAEESKRQFSSKANSSNVRGVGTFFGTCLNLGQLSSYNFKICHIISPEIWILNSRPFRYCMEFVFRSYLESLWNFRSSELVQTYK